ASPRSETVNTAVDVYRLGTIQNDAAQTTTAPAAPHNAALFQSRAPRTTAPASIPPASPRTSVHSLPSGTIGACGRLAASSTSTDDPSRRTHRVNRSDRISVTILAL